MNNKGLEYTDNKLMELCRKNIDADAIISGLKTKKTKTAIFGTGEFEIIFPDKLSELGSNNNLYILDKNYSGKLNKINSDKLNKDFELIYLGIKIGGVKELDIFKKNPKLLENISNFSYPLQDNFTKQIIKSTPELINPYFSENRKIKHSLIILSGMNNAGSLREMLKSFKKYTKPESDTEIIVVINGSDDGSIKLPGEILETEYNLTIINTPENLGISGGYNKGINIAKGSYITLMQDDITFSKHTWKYELEFYLDNYPKIGLLGGFRGGYYFKNNKALANDKFASPYIGRGSQLLGRCKWKLLQNYLVKVDSVNCMLVMFRKELGFYEEHLLPNGIEDIEFAFRARKNGYDVYVTDVGIAHGELLSTTREETKFDMLKKVAIKKITGKTAGQNLQTLSKRLSRAYHFHYFRENYFDMLRELPEGISPDKITLDEIAEKEHKIKRKIL